jgi:hypothetical protein
MAKHELMKTTPTKKRDSGRGALIKGMSRRLPSELLVLLCQIADSAPDSAVI